MKQGKDVLLVIDPQGAVSVKKIYPNGLFIFILPSSRDVLKERLKSRGTEDGDDLQVRLENAKKEIGYLSHYDYLVMNDDLEKAVSDVKSIISSAHLQLSRINQRDIPILN